MHYRIVYFARIFMEPAIKSATYSILKLAGTEVNRGGAIITRGLLKKRPSLLS